MPKVVKDFPRPVARRTKYPWWSWVDGKTRKFTQGTDFQTKPTAFYMAARAFSRNHNVTSVIMVEGDSVYIRFDKKDKAVSLTRPTRKS